MCGSGWRCNRFRALSGAIQRRGHVSVQPTRGQFHEGWYREYDPTPHAEHNAAKGK